MRIARTLMVFGLGLAAAGCALVEDGTRNLCHSVCSPIHAHKEKKRNRQWAELAWERARSADVIGGRSCDYADGFKEGFAEYLFRGGDGEPPVVAPHKYRQPRYQNPWGFEAVQDWFRGYRHGAAEAHASGARLWITGSSSLQSEPVDGGTSPAVSPPDYLPVPIRRRHGANTLPRMPSAKPALLLGTFGRPQGVAYSEPEVDISSFASGVTPTPPTPAAQNPFEVNVLPISPGAFSPAVPRMPTHTEDSPPVEPEPEMPLVQVQFGLPLCDALNNKHENGASNWTAAPLRVQIGLPLAEPSPYALSTPQTLHRGVKQELDYGVPDEPNPGTPPKPSSGFETIETKPGSVPDRIQMGPKTPGKSLGDPITLYFTPPLDRRDNEPRAPQPLFWDLMREHLSHSAGVLRPSPGGRSGFAQFEEDRERP